ncbi:MAG: CCA tRNA nucleotidyltransferase, partial [Elusimicrobia bacterium]|nr:CCA tRNA nucleotidyltransferase [Elusimicrobiota bacterium]
MALSTLHGTQLIRGLSSQWLPRLRQVGREAKAMGLNAFLVGGTVRDLLLKHPSGDPDIVVVGNPEPLVRRLGARWRATVLPHPQFLTFVLTFPDGTHLDVATARGERYETPAALPQVSPASIEEDLWRRDFSINALALGLNPSAWGQLLDPTGGLQDLQQLKIRVLHARSFWDDPTRIFRAARFAGRYQFTLEAQTLQWLREALIRRLPRRLSPERR